MSRLLGKIFALPMLFCTGLEYDGFRHVTARISQAWDILMGIASIGLYIYIMRCRSEYGIQVRIVVTYADIHFKTIGPSVLNVGWKS
jgi:hypothetical protein